MSTQPRDEAPVPTRRERQRQATYDEIVTVARRLLREGDAISLRAIAQEMGMTPPALYRYIDGFERVRLLAAKHPREELSLLCAMSPHVVTQYLAILDEHQLGRPVYRRRRVRRHG